MQPEIHSHNDWSNRLRIKAGLGELTLMETMALCLHNIQNHLYEVKLDAASTKQAQEHVEGMIGAIDAFFHQFATMQGLPYASSADIRAALDEKRDRDREHARLAFEEARKELTDASPV